MTRPFLPYARQVVEDDDVAAVVAALRSDFLTTGPAVAAFEEALAARVGARHVVAVSNGTAALHAACFAAGVGVGDEVIVPALTFVATANAACYLGARPVFADVDPDSGLVDPEQVERRLTSRTRAVIPVHLTGRPVDLGAIRALADRRGLTVIEDAAHALGATFDGRPVGSGPGLATFSFHPVKQITTGEGGAVAVQDDAQWRRLLAFRGHGIRREPDELEQPAPGPWYCEQQDLGHNLRLSDLACALGLSQLRKLDRFLARRRELAARYDARLAGRARVRPIGRGPAGSESAWHLYSVLIDFAELGLDRASVMAGLRERGIGSQVHYLPVPGHPYYRRRGWRAEDFPGATRYSDRTLSLPLYPALTVEDVDRVVDGLLEVLEI